MISKREQILDRLISKLKTLESEAIKVYRNLDKPQTIPPGGMIILRDGTSNEPETLLSPLTYIYEHLALLEVIVQSAYPEVRIARLDRLLISIGEVIHKHRTLDNLAEWIEAKAPDFQEEAIDGAATVRSATVQIVLRFSTHCPLN